MRKLKNEELDRKSVEEFKKAEKIPIVVVLDNVRSLHNVGSVFRTCDAFLVEALYLCGITAKPPHREINKTAIGATETVEWKYFKSTMNAVETLKEKGCKVIAIEQAENSTTLRDFRPSKNDKLAVIFGHEVKGVSQEIVSASDEVLEIEQFGTKHSLNISVSCGVVLYDIINKLR